MTIHVHLVLFIDACMTLLAAAGFICRNSSLGVACSQIHILSTGTLFVVLPWHFVCTVSQVNSACVPVLIV